MKKIMIIGCCGSGKSTLARTLYKALGIELIHLDQCYWQPNWTEPSPKEWEKTVQELVQKKQWIMDGNYGGTMDIRLAKADTIIFLNYSTLLCLSRVINRTLKYLGKKRPDMPQGCNERFDLSFLHYVATFKWRKEKNLLRKLNNLDSTKQVFIFKNDAETSRFVKKLAII